jgi:hypothetical protein
MRASPRDCRARGRRRNYSKCHNSGCSRNRSSCELIQQTRYKPVERIDFVGKGRGHHRETAVLVAEEETTPSATTLDVVEIAPHASSSNKLGINQSNGSRLFGKMRSSSQTTIEGHGKKLINHGQCCSLCQTCDKKSMYHERGCSLRETHDKKSIYIKHAHCRSLHLFIERISM